LLCSSRGGKSELIEDAFLSFVFCDEVAACCLEITVFARTFESQGEKLIDLALDLIKNHNGAGPDSKLFEVNDALNVDNEEDDDDDDDGKLADDFGGKVGREELDDVDGIFPESPV